MGCATSQASTGKAPSSKSVSAPVQKEKPLLGYWKIRCGNRGNANRAMLYWAGVDFNEKRYWNPADWQADKKSIPMEHPNLPYLKNGDFYITESKIVPAYICDTWAPELIGSGNPEQRARILQIQEVVVECYIPSLMNVFRTDDRETVAPIFMEAFKKVSDFLGEKPFLAGDNISFVDF